MVMTEIVRFSIGHLYWVNDASYGACVLSQPEQTKPAHRHPAGLSGIYACPEDSGLFGQVIKS
jgi:hypothetical protein